MMRILFVAFLLCWNFCDAQRLTLRYEIQTPDSLINHRCEWIDVDNNGLLDLVVFATSATDRDYMLIAPGDTLQTPVLLNFALPVQSVKNISAVDYNHDNQIDFISSSNKGVSKSEVYVNDGNFSFSPMLVPLPSFDLILFTDLDDDALEECVLSEDQNGGSVNFYECDGLNWILKNDSLKMKLSSLHSTDIDGDGELDLMISGTQTNGQSHTLFLINHRNFWFKPQNDFLFSGTSAMGDVNHDGSMDFILSGKDNNASVVCKVLKSANGQYTSSDFVSPLEVHDVFIADLNSDGLEDVSEFGKTTTGDTLNRISIQAGSIEIFSHKDAMEQKFGDLDHDGDLDLAQTAKNKIMVWENNTAEVNLPPVTIESPFGIPVFNRMFLYWKKPG